MPTLYPPPPNHASDQPSAQSPKGDLRPDLAAFFIKASRDTAPRRVSSELGILAELRAESGYF